MDISNTETTTSALSPNRHIAPEACHSNASAAFMRRRRRRTAEKDGRGEELTDDSGEVEEKIVALQKIVPGGERLPVEELFEETAEYILRLESQVKAMRFLIAFVQSPEKMKKMFAG